MVASLFTGCPSRLPVATYSVSDELVSGYDFTDKIPLTVELYLSDELRAGVWQQKGSSQSYQTIFGEAKARWLGVTLARNAELVTQTIFPAVVVTGGSEVPGMAGGNVVLIPRIVTIEQVRLVRAVTLTVILEWAMQDEHGNIIWVDTIRGEGEGEIFWSWEEISGFKALHKAMLNDLFHKSFSVLSSSRAIRDFAATHANPLPGQP